MSMGEFADGSSIPFEENQSVNSRPYHVTAILDDNAVIVWHSRLARAPNGIGDIRGRYVWDWAVDEDEAERIKTAIGRAWVVGPQRIEHVAMVDDSVEEPVAGFVLYFEKVRVAETPFLMMLAKSRDPAVQRLTDREKQVLWLGVNYTPEEIAEQLGIARSTVDSLRYAAAQKLGVSGSALTTWAVANL